MNPLGMTDTEYTDWLQESMDGFHTDTTCSTDDGQICRQGLYNWEDSFDGCWVCEDPNPIIGCADGYLHRPMYGATEDEITAAWQIVMTSSQELMTAIREMRTHDFDSY